VVALGQPGLHQNAPGWRPTWPAAPHAAQTRQSPGAARARVAQHVGQAPPGLVDLCCKGSCGVTPQITTATPARASTAVSQNRPARPTAAASSGASHQRECKHQPDAGPHQGHGLGADFVTGLVRQQGRDRGRHRPCALQRAADDQPVQAGGHAPPAKLPAANTSRPMMMTRLRPKPVRGHAKRKSAAAPASGHKCPWPGPRGPGHLRPGSGPPPAQTPAAPETAPACAWQRSWPASHWRAAPGASWPARAPGEQGRQGPAPVKRWGCSSARICQESGARRAQNR
jgi:hypothetical protein